MRRPYSNRQTEPNLRSELQKTFDGVFPEVSKKQYAVLRKMRRDDEDEPIKCTCVDAVTQEPDVDHFCPVCHGEGYLFDEQFIEVYKVVKKSDVGNAYKEVLIPPGVENVEIVTFYTTYEVDVTELDKIVELKLEQDGTPVLPYKRRKLYHIVSAIDFRLDGAKLEYWKLNCYEEERKFLNGV